jgi:hypothetical protein
MGQGAGDDQTRELITETYQRADAFLFGRRTYELFAGGWGAVEEMRAGPGRIASRRQGGNDPGLPARGASAVCRGVT